jgi:TRAP-type C4-dicarboxylate transport system substrate-binding protein
MRTKGIMGIILLSCLILVISAALILSGCTKTTPTTPSTPTPSTPSQPAPPAQEPIELSCATLAPQGGGAFAQELVIWSEEIAKRTDGLVTIKVYYGGTLATPAEMLDALRTGAIDIGHLPWGYFYPDEFPLQTISSECATYRGSPLAVWVAFDRLFDEFPEFEAEMTAHNMVQLSHHGNLTPGGIQSKKPILTLADLEGKKIVANMAKDTAIVKAVGAVQVGMPPQETLDAHQKGVIDGEVTVIGTSIRQKGFEVCKNWLRIEHPPLFLADTGMTNAMNLDVWNKLSPDVQNVLQELRAGYPTWYIDLEVTEKEAATKTLMDAGVEFHDLPQDENEYWASQAPEAQFTDAWIKKTAEKTGMPEAKLREMATRFSQLIDELEKEYPPIY